MSFRIGFTPTGDTLVHSIQFTAGELSYSGARQRVEGNYHDLLTNRIGLKKRTLKKLFICNEPIFNITYYGNEMEFFLFPENGERISSMERYEDVLSHFDGVISSMTLLVRHIGFDTSQIDREVREDIALGVVEPFM